MPTYMKKKIREMAFCQKYTKNRYFYKSPISRDYLVSIGNITVFFKRCLSVCLFMSHKEEKRTFCYFTTTTAQASLPNFRASG